MKLNKTTSYLAVMRASLQTQITPELASPGAKATAGVMMAIIDELARREQGSVEILSSEIDSGKQLLRKLLAATGVHSPDDREVSGYHMPSLMELHGVLTARIAEACVALTTASVDRATSAPLLADAAKWEYEIYRRLSSVSAELLLPTGEHGAVLTSEIVQDCLNTADEIEGHPEVLQLQPLPGGFGKQTFSVTIREENGSERDLIIRKMDPRPIMQHGGCMLQSEFNLLKDLASTDFIAPKPFIFRDGYGNVAEQFYICDRALGVVAGSYLGGAEKVSDEFFLGMATWLGKLHSYPIETFRNHIEADRDPRILTGTAGDAYRYALEGWAEYVKTIPHDPSPFIVWLLDWLSNNIPESAGSAPVLLHGDYNVHNILAAEGKMSVVLDWECADFGFPEQDLAWLKSNVESHFEWNRFLAAYWSAGGKRDLDPKAMKFGLAYAALRTSLAGNKATRNLQSGENMDIRYAMVELGFAGAFMSGALNVIADQCASGVKT